MNLTAKVRVNNPKFGDVLPSNFCNQRETDMNNGIWFVVQSKRGAAELVVEPVERLNSISRKTPIT
jgi:hypothetical protein